MVTDRRAPSYPAHDTRLRIVQRLLSGAIPATVVCPVIFLDNLLRGWALPALRDQAVLCYPHRASLPVSWITLGDVARIMITLGEDPRSAGEKFVVGGPEALCGPQTAAALGHAWGREVQFQSLPVADSAARMGELFGAGEPGLCARIAADLGRIYRWYNDAEPSPFTVDMQPFLRRYPLALTSVSDWARANPLWPAADQTQ